MKKLSKDRVCYAMSGANEPALCVAPGEVFCVETEDCYSGCLRRPEDRMPESMGGFGNPATGPVHVEGAAPGDILRVEIERIETRGYAVMHVAPGRGALAEQIAADETVVLPIEGGKLLLRPDVRVPIRPMIGVIGTAPAGEDVPTITPGEHGGNLDCREITAGAAVYLPVNVEGGLLALGDLHALMGDGEVCICGAEVSGEVTLRAHVVRSAMPTPCVETPGWVAFLGSALSLDECERMVLDKAHRFLTERVSLGANEAARVMSLVGELRVCQVVDPLKTMKFMLPRQILQSLSMGTSVL